MPCASSVRDDVFMATFHAGSEASLRAACRAITYSLEPRMPLLLEFENHILGWSSYKHGAPSGAVPPAQEFDLSRIEERARPGWCRPAASATGQSVRRVTRWWAVSTAPRMVWRGRQTLRPGRARSPATTALFRLSGLAIAQVATRGRPPSYCVVCRIIGPKTRLSPPPRGLAGRRYYH